KLRFDVIRNNGEALRLEFAEGTACSTFDPITSNGLEVHVVDLKREDGQGIPNGVYSDCIVEVMVGGLKQEQHELPTFEVDVARLEYEFQPAHGSTLNGPAVYFDLVFETVFNERLETSHLTVQALSGGVWREVTSDKIDGPNRKPPYRRRERLEPEYSVRVDVEDDVERLRVDVEGGVVSSHLGPDYNEAQRAEYVIDVNDLVNPTVVAIARVSPDRGDEWTEVNDGWTHLNALTFGVGFSEPVTYVDPTDFELINLTDDSVVSGVTVSVEEVDSATYNVTFSGGDLDDLESLAGVGLAFVSGTDIEDLNGRDLIADLPGEYGSDSNATFIMHNTPPTVSIEAPDSYYGAFTLTYQFDEPVTNFTLDDLEVWGNIRDYFFPEGQEYGDTGFYDRVEVTFLPGSRFTAIRASISDDNNIADRAGLIYGQPVPDDPGLGGARMAPMAEDDDEVEIIYDDTDFTAEIALEENAATDGSPFTVTATFARPAAYFDAPTDVTLVNATFDSDEIELVDDSDSKQYRFTVYPQVPDGSDGTNIEISISLPEGAALDFWNARSEESNTIT
ncbi:MAG: hypothetical protein HRU27_21095, partial [Rhizobiaceae bacterium]|nr:hypothetical protein [Hyphomicrobiales bacterium]NRB33084.1 hypothetical protein [Rhizobiaceae bacterium]